MKDGDALFFSPDTIPLLLTKGEFWMKSKYKRENLKITEFDAEDVITTSGSPDDPITPTQNVLEHENAYRDIRFLLKSDTWIW